MAWKNYFLFPSLVFCLACAVTALAEPHEYVPEKKVEAEQVEKTKNIEFDKQNLSVTPLSPAQESRLHRNVVIYPYRHAISPRLGVLVDPSGFPESDAIKYYWGFTYVMPKYYSPKWEWGLDVTTTSDAHIHLARRYIWNERQGFRPFYKLGISHRAIAGERLASFGNHENYFFRASLGMEDLLDPPLSFRIELDALVGAKEIFATIAVGYSYGWK